MAVDKVFYNEASQAKLGWDASWFGVENNDDELVDAVRKWQRKRELTADGLVGPMTYRRVWTEREASISEWVNKVSPNIYGGDDKHIVHNGNFIPIEWDKVILWDEEAGLSCLPGTYYDFSGKPDRKPDYFVNHWDVCLSSASCAKVIAKRGISIHFCIDNDGTIYQLLDTQHAAWQAGSRKWNLSSIGVEISNAYYTKYQEWYENHGFGARPLVKDAYVHGRKLKEHLGFYQVQLDALKALWKAIHIGLGIPLECPLDESGDLVLGTDDRCIAGEFNGFINHYNLTNRKIDCADLDMPKLISEVKQSPLYCLDS